MTSIDRQLAQHIADPTLRHPLDRLTTHSIYEIDGVAQPAEQRPDIDDKNARLLRDFAFAIEGLIERWRDKEGKCEALDLLVAKLTHDTADVIAAARVRAKECEEKSQVCTHHQGAT